MNRNIKIVNIIFISLFLFTSCSLEKEKDPIPFNEKYVNQQILIRTPAYANSFKTTDSIKLELKYNSTNEIIFPRDFNLKLFEHTKDGWVEMHEKPTERYPSGDIVFSPYKLIPLATIIFVFPDMPNYDRKHTLRIYVFGEMKEEGDIVEVAAYTDVNLHP